MLGPFILSMAHTNRKKNNKKRRLLRAACPGQQGENMTLPSAIKTKRKKETHTPAQGGLTQANPPGADQALLW